MRESISNIEVRNINRNNIVEALLREGTLTKAGIAQFLGLSLATVNTLLKELLEEGLVEQGEVLSSTGGRRPTLYQVVAGAKTAVGVGLTGHHIRISYVNWKQDVLKCSREKILFENTEEYWMHLRESVYTFLKENGLLESKIKGVGICFHAEIVDNTSLESIRPKGIFKGVDMEKIRRMYSCPVYFYDDMKSAAFSHIGSRANYNRCVYLQLDNRVGGAVINEGTFWGLSNRTGAFGNMLVGDGEAVDCEQEESCGGCGKKGCLQYYCSSKSLQEKSGYTLPEYFEKLEQGDEACEALWKTYKNHLIVALHNLRAIFDTKIMIGGKLAPYIQKHSRELEEALTKIDIYGEKCEYLMFSKGEEYDSAIGAGYLTIEKEEELKKRK